MEIPTTLEPQLTEASHAAPSLMLSTSLALKLSSLRLCQVFRKLVIVILV
jgi:hypothetical protein